MFLPSAMPSPAAMAGTPAFMDYLEDEPPTSRVPGGWSSIIGIICALAGNVLISFALNTQRYAHIRLAREAGEISSMKEASQQGKPKHKKVTYGTIQEDIAEERAQKNAKAAQGPMLDHDDANVSDHEGDSERDALIPHIEEPTSDASSESTIRGDEKQTKPQKKKNYLKSKWWWAGIAMMTVGETGNFLAYGFAPASIVSPLGVVALISNCIIAPIMLKEKFRIRDLIGVLIAVVGAATVVVSAKGSNPKLGPEEIGALLTRWEFLTYLGITCAAIIALMFASNKYGGKTVVIDIGLVGLFGGYTALSTKGVASLLSYRPLLIFTYPLAYLLIAVLVFTAVMQIKYVNRALQRFDSTQVIPVQFVCFTISVVVGSAVLYRDFEKTTADKLGEFFGGVVLTFLGVWCITSGRGRKHDDVEDLETAEHHQESTIILIDDEATEGEETLEEDDDAATPIPTPLATSNYSTFAPASSSESSLSYVTASTALPGTSPSSTASTIHAPSQSPTKPQEASDTSKSSVKAPPRYTSTRSTPSIPHASSQRSQRSRSATPQLPVIPSTPPPTSSRPTAHRHISDISFSPLHPSANSAQTSASLRVPSGSHQPSQSQTQAGGSTKPAYNTRHPSIVERMFSSSSSGFHSLKTLALAPGPLTSPLSAGLSVVVADSLRGLPRGAGVGERDVSAQSEDRKGGAGSARKRGRSSGRRASKSLSRRPSEMVSQSRRGSEMMGADGRSYDGAAAGLGASGGGGDGGTRRSSRAVLDEEEEEDVIDEAEEASSPAQASTSRGGGKRKDGGGG